MKGKTATTQVATPRKTRAKGLRTPPVHMGQLPGTSKTGRMPRLEAKIKRLKPRKKPKSPWSSYAKLF